MPELEGMTYERWKSLMEDPNGRITEAEMALGWHWCYDWDQLLVGPGMPMEQGHCGCFKEENL